MSGSHYEPEPPGRARPAAVMLELVREFSAHGERFALEDTMLDLTSVAVAATRTTPEPADAHNWQPARDLTARGFRRINGPQPTPADGGDHTWDESTRYDLRTLPEHEAADVAALRADIATLQERMAKLEESYLAQWEQQWLQKRAKRNGAYLHINAGETQHVYPVVYFRALANGEPVEPLPADVLGVIVREWLTAIGVEP